MVLCGGRPCPPLSPVGAVSRRRQRTLDGRVGSGVAGTGNDTIRVVRSVEPARRPVALRDRLLALLARFVTRWFFRSVETVGSLPPHGPVILAASHLNGFVDPVMMVADVGALPRFLAKATLWKVAVARPFLAFARVIPVHRSQDAAEGAVDNNAMFASAVEALREGHLLALFPEGTTHDEPTLRPLRTGAARIALQAAGAGVEGVQIVPVGILYEDKVAVRGRALIEYGEPIRIARMDDAARSEELVAGPEPHEVRALTEEIRVSLAALSTDFRSTEEAVALQTAAAVALRSASDPNGVVPMAEVAEVARRLAAEDPETVDHLVSTVARYSMLLGYLGLSDRDLVHPDGVRQLARKSVVLAVLTIVLAPLAIAGLFANLVPAVLVLVAGLVPKAPVSKGTIRVLVALVAFPVTWVVLAVFDVGFGWLAGAMRAFTFPLQPFIDAAFGTRDGFAPGLLVFVAAPIFGAFTLLMIDRFRALIRAVGVWRTVLDRRGQLPEIRSKREALVELVAATAAAES